MAKDLVGEEHFTTQWPMYGDYKEKKLGYSELTLENGDSLYSEKFVISEFILNINFVLVLCAKCIV